MAENKNAIKKREGDNIELFENYLVSVLKKGVGNTSLEDKELLMDINYDIISLFDEDPDFQKKIENVLYQNQEKLTSKKFILEEQNKRPTVGNWIKHFIKEEGTEMYSDVTLSGFLSNSSNVKKLDQEEVNLVRALLVLYRNLKFFPKSMKGDHPEEWEIIPIREEGQGGTTKEVIKNNVVDKKEKDDPVTEKEVKDTQDITSPDTSYSSGEEAKEEKKQANKPRINKRKEDFSPQEEREVGREETRLEKLKRIKDNYKEDSLERKAIESEIKELEDKNKEEV